MCLNFKIFSVLFPENSVYFMVVFFKKSKNFSKKFKKFLEIKDMSSCIALIFLKFTNEKITSKMEKMRENKRLQNVN